MTVCRVCEVGLGFMTLAKIVREFQNDPARYYASIWEAAGRSGIFWDDELESWIVTSYALCASLLNSKSLSRRRLSLRSLELADALQLDAASTTKLEIILDQAQGILDMQMFFDDSQAASLSREYWRAYVAIDNGRWSAEKLESIADTFLSDAPKGVIFDIYNIVLRKYVSACICSVLGVCPDQQQRYFAAIYDFANLLDGKATTAHDIVKALIGVGRLTALGSCKRFQVPEQSHDSGVDLHRWVADWTSVLIAGHESVAFLLGTVLLYSAGDDFQQFLRPDRTRQVLQEALRIDAPIQMVGRVASSSLSLANRDIGAREKIFLHIGAANRDKDQFYRSSDFLSTRQTSSVLTFGLGRNRCIGMPLAIAMAEAFLRVLANHAERMRIHVHDARWAGGLSARSFETLTVTIESVLPETGI
jgi:cytochrome P450